MKAWEFLRIGVGTYCQDTWDDVEQAGRDGWELVAVTSLVDSDGHEQDCLYFKRPLALPASKPAAL